MKFLAGASLLVAAASAMPTSLGERGNEVCNAARSVSIVVDSSASNKGTDPNNLRLVASTDVINGLNFQQDRVSVVSFNDQSTLHYPLGNDKNAALQAIQQIDARGNTKISEGLAQGLEQIINLGQDARDHAGVVVFTDGLDYTKPQQLKLLQKAKEAGIRVSWGHLSADEVHPKNGKRDLDGQMEERTFGVLKNVMSSVISMFCGIKGGGSPPKGQTGGPPGGNPPTGGGTNIVVRPATPLDQEISAACLSTGGTVSIIGNANAQQSFIQQVIKNGMTNNDGRCGGIEVDQSGGLLKNNVTSLGLCSNNAHAEFTYTPEKTKEKLAFTVSLVSTANKVSIKAIFENTANGAKNEILVNSQNPSLMLTGEANVGEQVKVSIQPEGASADSCQYSVGLIAVADELVQSASSSLVIEGTLIEQGTIVGQHTGNVEEHVSQTASQGQQSATYSEGTVSSATASQTASSATVSQTASSYSEGATVSQGTVSGTVSGTASGNVSGTASGNVSGTVSGTASGGVSGGVTVSGTASGTASGGVTVSGSATHSLECPTPAVPTVTQTETKTVSVTGAAQPTDAICLCKCDVKGAKPFPKVNEL